VFAQGWLQTANALISASWLGRIRGMNHRCLTESQEVLKKFLIHGYWTFKPLQTLLEKRKFILWPRPSI
jgi:hypothetical protein